MPLRQFLSVVFVTATAGMTFDRRAEVWTQICTPAATDAAPPADNEAPGLTPEEYEAQMRLMALLGPG